MQALNRIVLIENIFKDLTNFTGKKIEQLQIAIFEIL